MSTASDVFALLAEVPSEGLHIRQLADLNELSDGFGGNLGLRFTEVTPEKVVAEMHVTADHLQATGVVNGGIFCTIAETVASIAGVVAARGAVVTGVNNNTDFLSSVRAGVILAEATVIRAGRRTQLIAVDMIHKHTLVARSTLRTMVTPAPAEGNPGRPADKFEDAQ